MSNHITPEPKSSDPATRGHFCDNTGCVFFIELPVELAQPPVVPAALHDAEARRQLVQVGRLGRRRLCFARGLTKTQLRQQVERLLPVLLRAWRRIFACPAQRSTSHLNLCVFIEVQPTQRGLSAGAEADRLHTPLRSLHKQGAGRGTGCNCPAAFAAVALQCGQGQWLTENGGERRGRAIELRARGAAPPWLWSRIVRQVVHVHQVLDQPRGTIAEWQALERRSDDFIIRGRGQQPPEFAC